MAIVINGSGTVTGISVGGLPDDIVDAGMMADNSIDSDAYVDASIDNAHLADDAVGVAELSATGTASSSTFLRGDNSWAEAGGGEVLQVVRDNNNGDTYIGGHHSSYTDTGLTVTLTTAGANSKFIISVGTGMHYTSGQDSYTNIRRNISGGANTGEIVPGTYGLFHERATGWTNGSGEFVDYPSIAASTSVTYTVQIKNSGSVDWCHSAGYCYITVTEVAA